MSVYNYSNLLSSVPNISWLVWLYKNGHLTSVISSLTENLSYNKSRSPDFYPELFESIEPNIELEFGQPDYLSDIDIDEFSSALNELISAEFGYVHDDDHYWLADLIFTPSDKRLAITSAPNQIFLHNWKFSGSMHSSLTPYFIILNFLNKPHITPITTDYNNLNSYFRKIIKSTSDPLSVDDIQTRLKDFDVEIDRNFLITILLNDENWLLLHRNGSINVAPIRSFLAGWDLAIELFESREYLSTSGLNEYSILNFDELELRPNISPLKTFFNVHNKKIDWCEIDPLEICLKLRVSQNKPIEFIQGIPKHIHKFICDWLKNKNSMWINRSSKYVLGKAYKFKVAEIPPGPLLVYGNAKNLSDQDRLALVRADMVSEDKQTRGKIHPSRILTPFKTYNFNPETYDVDTLISFGVPTKDFGVVDADEIAKFVLIKESAELKPYNIRQVTEYLLNNLPSDYQYIGKGLIADLFIHSEITHTEILKYKRKIIYDKLVPRGISLNDYTDELDAYSSRIVNKLYS